eukprot:6474040-Amphidinium_carterae.1
MWEELQADREAVLKAVRIHGRALEYAAENLCDDREVVATAVTRTPSAFTYASHALTRLETTCKNRAHSSCKASIQMNPKIDMHDHIVSAFCTKFGFWSKVHKDHWDMRTGSWYLQPAGSE